MFICSAFGFVHAARSVCRSLLLCNLRYDFVPGSLDPKRCASGSCARACTMSMSRLAWCAVVVILLLASAQHGSSRHSSGRSKKREMNKKEIEAAVKSR